MMHKQSSGVGTNIVGSSNKDEDEDDSFVRLGMLEKQLKKQMQTMRENKDSSDEQDMDESQTVIIQRTG